TVGNGNVSTSSAINTGGSDSVAGLTGCADKASQAGAFYIILQIIFADVLKIGHLILLLKIL
ncbi:MAG: hypothetical protein PHF16_01845, partial [Atribacterota bacterium]|nr:hypothetical protein [Atribacterota bacterium]